MDTIISEFRNQEEQYIQKVNPKLRDAIKYHLNNYDLSHSVLKIVKAYKHDSKLMLEKLKLALAEREIFLTKLVEKC